MDIQPKPTVQLQRSNLCYTERIEVLRHVLYHTLTQTSLPQLLHYEDRNSMAFSIESHMPFLTPGLAKRQFDFCVWRWMNLILWAEKFGLRLSGDDTGLWGKDGEYADGK